MSENTNVNTPYDDVFRTLMSDCPHFVIRFINEAFGTNYNEDASVTLKENELFLPTEDGKQQKRITDSRIVIENVVYHIECQSTVDGSILIRIWEYDTMLASKEAVIKDNTLTIKLPNTAVLHLKSYNTTPDYGEIVIIAPNGETLTYPIKYIKIKDYSVEEIFEKKLFFLIPFHIFCYESKFKKYDDNDTAFQTILKTYEYIFQKLRDYPENVLTTYERKTIEDLSKKVLDQIAKNHDKVRKGIGDVMGGKILDYEAKTILKQGVELGRKDNIASIIDSLQHFNIPFSEVVKEIMRKFTLSEEEATKQVLSFWPK